MEVLKRVVRPESFPAAFVFLIITAYLIRPNPTWAVPFYAAVLPLGLWTAWRHRHARWLRDPGLALSLVAIGWFGLSVTWSVGADAERLAKYTWAWLVTSLFVVVGVTFFAASSERWRERLFALLPWGAILNALISVALWVSAGALGRLEGWAETRHSILGSNVMILAGVVALSRLSAPLSRVDRGVALAALLCVTVFVILSGSRGPLLAWAGCIGVFVLLRGYARMVLMMAAFGAVVAAGLFLLLCFVTPATLPAPLDAAAAAVQANMNRPSLRLEIWQLTLAEWTKAPIFGWGAAAQAHLADVYLFPHSLYLSTLYYTGVVGAVLLLALFGHLALRVWRAPTPAERAFLAALLTLPAVAGLTDLSGLISGPSELWLIVWMPAIIIIGRTAKETEVT